MERIYDTSMIVSLEVAKLLKEKGFNEWTFYCYLFGPEIIDPEKKYNGRTMDHFEDIIDLVEDGTLKREEWIKDDYFPWKMFFKNDAKDLEIFGTEKNPGLSAPMILGLMRWLSECKKIYVGARPKYIDEEGQCHWEGYALCKEKNFKSKVFDSLSYRACMMELFTRVITELL